MALHKKEVLSRYGLTVPGFNKIMRDLGRTPTTRIGNDLLPKFEAAVSAYKAEIGAGGERAALQFGELPDNPSHEQLFSALEKAEQAYSKLSRLKSKFRELRRNGGAPRKERVVLSAMAPLNPVYIRLMSELEMHRNRLPRNPSQKQADFARRFDAIKSLD